MDREFILILFEDIKYLMKTCDFIKVEGNIAIGVENKYIFKEVNLSIFVPYPLYITKSSELMNIYKITNIDLLDCYNNILSFEFEGKTYGFNLSVISAEGNYLLNNKYIGMKQLSQGQSIQYNELNKNEQFSALMNLKTSDGSSIFKLDRYLLYLYKGLLPINKGNTVNLKIIEYFNYFIAEFTILKPKNKYVKIILAYLKL